MFRKEDFKKVDLLGSGKKNTKIYKVIHRHSGKFYALKEVEAKSLDKLNEYKVSSLCTIVSTYSRIEFLAIGRSSPVIQGLEQSQRYPVLWLLLLRDHVQYLPDRHCLRIPRAPPESGVRLPQTQADESLLEAGRD